jgi:hypothetical protein
VTDFLERAPGIFSIAACRIRAAARADRLHDRERQVPFSLAIAPSKSPGEITREKDRYRE